MVVKEDMLYDGDELDWYGIGKFKATSGMKGSQTADKQTVKDEGPVPEGYYKLQVRISGTARVVDVAKNKLDVAHGVQSLDGMPGPDGKKYWSAAWGLNRVRLAIIRIDDPKARHRNGFYLHDSTKGYSHGCVEVDTQFFTRLRALAAAKKHADWLILRIKYPTTTESTYGKTDKP